MGYKLSICIPTYNRVAQLADGLNHILPQVSGYQDEVEIIISDNASGDNTESLVREYQKNYPQVKYFKNQENLGIDRNIKACIERASGEYLSFFSDDDIALPGTFKRIIDLIDSHYPLIICLNHYSFEGNNYLIKRRVFLPRVDKFFDNGLEFFLFTGLGFISSLTLKTELAKKFIDSINFGKCCAHLDIASRVALKMKGLFIFLGTQSVAARAEPQKIRGNLLLDGYIYVNQVYRELQGEGLLTDKIVQDRERRLLKNAIPRYILNELVMGNCQRIYQQRELVRKELGRHWQFYFYVYPLFFIPRFLIAIPYRIIYKLIKLFKFYLYN